MQQVDGMGQLDTTRRRGAARRYVETFYRHWLIVLVPILILPMASLGVTRVTKGGTGVATNVYVSQDSTKLLGYADPMATPATNAQGALQELLQTRTFDVLIAKASPLYWATVAAKPDPAYEATSDLSKNVKVVPDGSTLVGITYTTKIPAVGLQLLASLLKLAPREMVRLEQRQAATSTAYYDRQQKAIKARLARDTQALGVYAQDHKIPASEMAAQALFDSRFAALYQAVEADQTDLHNAQQQLAQVTSLAAAGSAIEVLDPPGALPSSTGKKTLILDLGIGLIVGLLLSGVFVVVTTARDHSLRSADDVSALLGLPVLASLPHIDELARAGRQLGSTRKAASGVES